METKRKSEENCFENTSKLLLFRFYNNVRAVLKSGLTGPCFRKRPWLRSQPWPATLARLKILAKITTTTYLMQIIKVIMFFCISIVLVIYYYLKNNEQIIPSQKCNLVFYIYFEIKFAKFISSKKIRETGKDTFLWYNLN